MNKKVSKSKTSNTKSAKNVVSKAEPKMKMKKQVLEKFDHQIINFYHAHPPLWNTADPKYKDTIFKNLLIQKLAKILNLECKEPVDCALFHFKLINI